MALIVMLSPVPFKTFAVSSGNVYVSDRYGIINSVVSVADQRDLVSAGCAVLNPNFQDLLGSLLSANFNVSTDQQFINLNNSVRYRVKRIVVLNTSVNGMSTAAGGIYTAASKGGTAIVAAGQVYTGLTNATTCLELTLNAATLLLAANTPLYLSLTTPQGAPATADVYLFGDNYP